MDYQNIALGTCCECKQFQEEIALQSVDYEVGFNCIDDLSNLASLLFKSLVWDTVGTIDDTYLVLLVIWLFTIYLWEFPNPSDIPFKGLVEYDKGN